MSQSNTSIQPQLSTYVRGRLRIARTEFELTQAQVAERMGVTQTAVSYWESGERQIGLDELLDFAVATNQPVEFFLPSPEPPQTGIPALDERDELREAAMWVVLNWDAERTQHGSMPALRRALGLPGERPTREEAERRINQYIGVEVTR